MFLSLITRFISLSAGILSSLTWPLSLIRALKMAYCKFYKLDLSEAEQAFEAFNSLKDLFLRKLKPACRPVPEQLTDKILSPVDGCLRGTGRVNADQGLQVKSIVWNWPEFIIDPQLSKHFDSGTYFNFYLSPQDYHHVHLPYAGRIRRILHHAGGLLPVNDWSVKTFPNLFCYNERVVCLIEAQGFNYLLIMIGALNVGSIELAAAPGFSRSFFEFGSKEIPDIDSSLYQAGQRFGSFSLGSSVVLVFPPDVIKPTCFAVEAKNIKVKYGSIIADIVARQKS